ncbi:hypothetical protein RIF29_34898 [Crotalaria pallida]|uniref:FRIGIDA-like protein n=1 Tax=Crotalaria pallida TaxID=3830 RepID=A0AAN9E9M3_CROPI
MATQSSTNKNRVHQFFDEVEAHKRILTNCTNLFTTLENHYTSLHNSLSQKSQSLDSKLHSLQSNSSQTLTSLLLKEDSIPHRESAAAALIDEQKDSALADLRKPLPSNQDLSAALKSLCRRMDCSALMRFIVSKRKESASLRAEIAAAVAEAVDPPRLVLDAVEDFLNSKSAKSGATDKRWACGILIQALVPEPGAQSVEYSRRIVERAAGVVERWKGQLDGEAGNGTIGAAEVVMFLQMVVCFGLRGSFDDEYLTKSVMEYASRRDMAKLAATLGFGDKMIGPFFFVKVVYLLLVSFACVTNIIDELVKNGREIEAVYFASESGLTERFPPVTLLKSYLRNNRKNATTSSKKGATDDSNTSESNSIKALIKCVEDHKLESEFNLESLRRRVTQLEKNKADRKKSSASGSKPLNKRAYGSGSARGSRGSGSSSNRPAKAAKFSSYPSSSSSFSRRNLAPSLQPSPGASRFSTPYNYPTQTIYDSSTANPYAATYGTSHSQSSAGITQQHYSLPVDNLAPSGYRTSSSYPTGQTSYGGIYDGIYDYGSSAPPSYQTTYTLDQTTYRG